MCSSDLDPANQQLRLVFEGVDAQAWVYVNGEQAGEQSSAATGLPPDELWDDPFAVVVSGAKLRYPDPNLLAVRVQAGPCNGGIYEAVIASLEPAR